MNKKTFDTTNAGSKNQFAGNTPNTGNKTTGGYTAPTAGGLKHDQTRTNTNINRPTSPTAKTTQPTQQGGWKDKKGGGTCK